MVEVFKTDVTDPAKAEVLLRQISDKFLNYQANFDLEDCDNILRVNSSGKQIECSDIVNLLRQFGHKAEPLQ